MERLRAFWNRGWIGKVVLISGGLIGLLSVCCVFLVVIALRTAPQSAQATAVPPTVAAAAPTETPAALVASAEPTEITAPTNTPVPTNTPEPTAAPEPTEAPTPAPTEAPAIPAAVRAYMGQMGEEIGKIGESLQALSGLLTDPKPADDNWKIDLAVQIVTIQQAHKALTAIDPPTEMADIHSAVLDATGDCDTSMRFLTSGIDDNNVGDVRQAVTYMGQCSEKIVTAKRQVDEYTEAHQ